MTRSYYPNIGGVEKHIYKLSQELSKKGIEVLIITEKTHSNNYQLGVGGAKYTGIDNVRVIEIEAGRQDWFKKFRIWKELFRNIDLIKSSDVIHCHDVYFWYLPFRLIFPKKKNYVTFHGYEGNNLPSFKAYLMHKIAEVLSNGNICVGEFLKKWYHTKPNYITYGAIDNKLSKKNRTVSTPRNRAIFIGRLEHETGILEYLKAIKILKDRKIDFTLDIYGDGSLRNSARNFVESNDLPVNFIGFKDDVENFLPKYGFALVSRYLSILEAMAVRMPIFAHYNNEIKRDYLEMTPFAKFITISNSYEVIAQQLHKSMLGENSNVEKAYAWVKDKTWEYMAGIYFELWKNS